jgi:hypothetical protein
VNLRYAPAVTTPATPAGWYPDPDGSGGQRYWDGSGWTEHRSPAPEEPEPTAQPAAASHESGVGPTSVIHLDSMPSEQPSGAPHDTGRRNLIIGFGAACAVLLAVLVAVVVYGLFFNNSDTISASSGPSSTSK